MNTSIGEYRLLMFQPDPESGERICVGIVLEGKLLFDPHFSRVQCFSKKVGIPYLRAMVEDIRDAFDRSRSEEGIEQSAVSYSPMFQLSGPRKVVTPLDQSIKAMLLKRFVVGVENEFPHPTRGEARKQFSSRLLGYASEALQKTNNGYRVIENARPVDVLGEKREGIRRVALAMRRENTVILLDGLDLNLLNEQDAMRECTNVVRTFWQYKIAQKPHGERICRAAVIFNGIKRQQSAVRDMHSFVSAQFEKESDQMIEAHSGEDISQLAGVLSLPECAS